MAARVAGQAPANPAACRSEHGALLGPVARPRIVTPIPELVLQHRTPQAPVGHVPDRFAVGLEPDVEDPAPGLFRRRACIRAMRGPVRLQSRQRQAPTFPFPSPWPPGIGGRTGWGKWWSYGVLSRVPV